MNICLSQTALDQILKEFTRDLPGHLKVGFLAGQ